MRITGAVIGDTIQYDEQDPADHLHRCQCRRPDSTDLGAALHNAVSDPNATRLPVRVENTVKPELLQNEAQAIMTGTLGTDGVFHVTELLPEMPVALHGKRSIGGDARARQRSNRSRSGAGA